jgi:hypothetical protein
MDVILNVVPFPPPAPAEPDPSTLAMLEDMLARVRAGEVSHAGVVGCCADGSITTGFTAGNNLLMLAAATHLQYRINRFMKEP